MVNVDFDYLVSADRGNLLKLIKKQVCIKGYLSEKILIKDEEIENNFLSIGPKYSEYENIYAGLSKEKYQEKYILKAKLRNIKFTVNKSFIKKHYNNLNKTNFGIFYSNDYNKRWLGW